MIQGTNNTGYSLEYYFVFEDLIYRYDGVCVDKCVDMGRPRTQKEIESLKRRMAKEINKTKKRSNDSAL